MNERILEFAKQTGLCDADGDFFGGKISQYDEFAELIIKECARVISDDQLAKDCDTLLIQSWANGMRYSAHLIKEHFRVNDYLKRAA